MKRTLLSIFSKTFFFLINFTLYGSCPVGSIVSNYSVNAPRSLFFAPNGNFLAVTSDDSTNQVLVFNFDSASGDFTFSSSAATRDNPSSVTYSPNGQFAAVANESSKNISIYSVDQSNGAFTEIVNSPVGTGGAPAFVAYFPNGNFAAVVTDSNVQVFTVNPVTGAFTFPHNYADGDIPNSIAFSPNGFAAVSNTEGSSVTIFSVDASTGVLTEIAGSPFVTTGAPFSVAYSPDGNFLAIADYSHGQVAVYTVDNTGALTGQVAGSPFATGLSSQSVAYSPDGNFAAVANTDDNTVSIFSVDQATGVFTNLPGSPLPVTGSPQAVQFSLNSKFLGSANFNTVQMIRIFQTSDVPVLATATIDSSGIVTAMGNNAVPGATINLIADGSTSIGTGVADGAGNFNVVATTPLSSGIHAITVTQTFSGCTSNQSNSISVGSVPPPPTPPSGVPPVLTGATVNPDGFVTVTGTGAQPGATLLLVLNGTTIIGTGMADGAGNFIFTSSSIVPSGLNVVAVTQAGTATDLSNNILVAVGVPFPSLFITRLIEKYFI